MEKKLRKVISNLGEWLSELNQLSLNLQRDMMQNAKNEDSSMKVQIDSLAHTASRIRQEIGNQKKALNILQRTPPGMTAAVIDFMYNLTVDTNAPTQKAQYLEQLTSLDRKINKDYVSVENALNIPDYSIRSSVRSALRNWRPVQSIKEDLFDVVRPVAQNMLTPRLLQSSLTELKETLAQYIPEEKLNQEINQLLEILKTSLKGAIAEDKHQVLEEGFNRIKQHFSTKTSSIRYASNNDLAQIVSNYKQQLEQLSQKNNFIQQVDQLLSELDNKADAKALDTAQRYSHYVKELLGGQNGSIATLVKSALKNLTDLSRSVGEQAIPGSEQINEPDVDPSN